MNNRIFFLIRARNAFAYFDRCIDSVFSQRNEHYTIIYIDDASPLRLSQKIYIRQKLLHHIVQFNRTRKYAVRNAYEAIHKYVPDGAIVISLDGDDWLVRDDVVDIIQAVYIKTQCDLTYGNCIYYNPGDDIHNKAVTDVHPFANRRFPKEIAQLKLFRFDQFRPLHLKTWKAKLFKTIPKDRFLFPNGSWLRFCEDQAIFYPLLELSGHAYEVIDTPLSAYNISHKNSDDVRYRYEKIVDEIAIRRYAYKSRKLIEVTDMMDDKQGSIFVSYSPLTHGWMGTMNLVFQLLFLMCNMTRRIYLGNQRRFLERMLVLTAEKKSNRFIVQSYDVGFSLSQCTHPVILDTAWGLKKLTSRQLEVAMWSLTFSWVVAKYCLDDLASIGIFLKKYGLVQILRN